MDFLSIGFCKQTNKQRVARFSLSNMQLKKGSKRIEMIIKMLNEFKLTVVHFTRPNPMQICACAWIYRWTKKLWKIRTGPPGLWATGPLRAFNRGPLGRSEPWAAGLLLAKPLSTPYKFKLILNCSTFICNECTCKQCLGQFRFFLDR